MFIKETILEREGKEKGNKSRHRNKRRKEKTNVGMEEIFIDTWRKKEEREREKNGQGKDV